ncbi:hypothetical protein KUTeg_007681 [Tegillarca granosa]|uniref:MAP3K HisK-N-like globin domain-containing protein n=1 Tax=Tegillarca granosa TaxID=220873 RepID=A0ABQ9FE00_TEGGR|nr:hypothetical protein KUTeg_007681 [Tegillarca granosa]
MSCDLFAYSDPKYHRSRSLHTGLVMLDVADGRGNLRLTMPRSRSPSPFRPLSPLALTHDALRVSPDSQISACSSLNLSPDVSEVEAGSVDSSGRDGGFYLLRKDSERRITLVHILTHDIDQNHIHVDLNLHVYYSVASLCVIKNLTFQSDKLKEAVDFDVTATMEIQLALYVFHEAPHWMFALDSLLRNAVQAAINVLSPELGANIAGNNNKEEENETSGVPSTNSAKSNLSYRKTASKELNSQLETIEEENIRLLQELVDVSRAFGETLKKSISEKKLIMEHIQIFSEFTPGIIATSSLSSREMFIDNILYPSAKVLDHSYMFVVPEIHEPPDESLLKWLKDNHFDADSIDKICHEQFILDDLLEILTGGVKCRLWRLILEHRKERKKMPD